MMRARATEVAVLGGGPAGLAAARAAAQAGAKVLLIEREERLGGILKQCVHDGFGVLRHKAALTGPEYAAREADAFRASGAGELLEAYLAGARRVEGGFELACVSRAGVDRIRAASLVLATGCRERTDRQVFIHGDRPAGIYTAGLAQYFVNVQGCLPGRRVLILGSGDIGLIMARRLTLEGAEVVGVLEAKPEPSGLSRNVRQCLEDYGIALTLSSTVTAVHGRRRVEGVVAAAVDARMRPVAGSEREIACDALVLSVGLIPENEVALALGVPLDPATKGPKVDQDMHTLVDGVFACGNAVHVHDLADYVSESGERAGAAAARWALEGPRRRELGRLGAGPGFLYAVPQYIDASGGAAAIAYFRAAASMPAGARLRLLTGRGSRGRAVGAAGAGDELISRRYAALRPPEMERVALPDSCLRSEGLVLELSKLEGADHA